MSSIKSSSKIEIGDARHLPLDDNSIHVSIFSPPYNVDIPYNNYKDSLSREDYEQLTRDYLKEQWRVLVPGGRCCVNVNNTGRRPYVSLNSLVKSIAEEIGFLVRGEIIWYKGSACCRGRTTWGSYLECTNPVIRDCHEYIIPLSKGKYDLNCDGFPKHDISPTDFANFTVSVWRINPFKIDEHPAPFPIEIPYRLIKLYSRPGMNILDPFCGSGNTMLASKKLGRNCFGFDIDEDYVKLTRKRLDEKIYIKKSKEKKAKTIDKFFGGENQVIR